MRRIALITVICVFVALPATADIVPLTSATSTGFQDEGTLLADHTALLSSLDGQWAPSTGGTVAYNYYATGTSPSWMDAVSLNFDLSGVGSANILSAELAFYTQQGAYSNTTWHHYQILEGAFNPTNQDEGPLTAVGHTDFGSYGSNNLVGWLSEPIPLAWITGDNFNITLRLWNARIDQIQLVANVVPVPGAVLLGMLGLSLAGVKLRKRSV